jgi:hypothetical protein
MYYTSRCSTLTSVFTPERGIAGIPAIDWKSPLEFASVRASSCTHSFIFHVHKYPIFWIVKACDSLRKIKQVKSNICFLPMQWRSYYSSISWLPMMLITSLLHGLVYENQIGHYSIGLIIEMNGTIYSLFLFLACYFCLALPLTEHPFWNRWSGISTPFHFGQGTFHPINNEIKLKL